MDVVYLDVQKTFHKVPHQRLLGNDAINWIEKWLTDRRQRVIVDGGIYIYILKIAYVLILIYVVSHHLLLLSEGRAISR